MSQQVVETVEQLAAPILAAEGLELVDITFQKEGKNWYLRLFIDKIEGRVDLDDISRVSEKLSEELDRVDPIPGAYFLEVSSPGAERPLKKPRDFERAVGKFVHITTLEPVAGRNKFEGTLTAYAPDVLTVEVEGKPVEIPFDKVSKARLAIVF
ncbi:MULTISPECIES: ribosome maturation factor RimP [Polycladomyces]|uniref:Ribosome maturation factor RimP n=3 Tax=Polycladomyces TaxID=1348505 RepID=A0A8D5UHM0_9BACL|nr:MULTISPECIES: ribosome maturation factor RimP [Polycladomyces]MBN2909364.1 ribosome maturation factor RimP [Polycladomyces sp. WAk]MDN4594459.1 ribosome maturation factor RimP [Polycladomyces subterraneus]BCU82060.1 ribosome maturation factor RimP [Polycladomyces abyssicola]